VEKVLCRAKIELERQVQVLCQFRPCRLEIYCLSVTLRNRSKSSSIAAKPLDPFFHSFSCLEASAPILATWEKHRSGWRRKRESQLPSTDVATSGTPFPKLKFIDDVDQGSMADFLSGLSSSNDDIDFDRAVSAFPDISLDGSGDIPTPTLGGAPVISHQTSTSSYTDFDDFVTPPPHNDVKVTGDDEIEQFESQFPDIGVPVVSANSNTQPLGLTMPPSLHLL